MALAYRYNSSYSSRLNSGWRGSFGAILTIVIHIAVVAILLVARNETIVPPAPLSVNIFADTPKQEREELRPPRPVLPEVAKVHVPQPEIVLNDPTPSQAINATVTPPPPSKVVSSEPPAPTEPRFDADYLNNPQPQYPKTSLARLEQGEVMLRVYVLPSGLPETIELKTSSGSVRLDQAALATVRKWRFIPAKRGDVAVGAWVLVPVIFNLTS